MRHNYLSDYNSVFQTGFGYSYSELKPVLCLIVVKRFYVN